MGVEADGEQAPLTGRLLQPHEKLAPDAHAANLGGDPHALDLGDSRREGAQGAAGGGLAEDMGHQEGAGGRLEVIEICRTIDVAIEALRKAGGNLIEITAEAHPRLGSVHAHRSQVHTGVPHSTSRSFQVPHPPPSSAIVRYNFPPITLAGRKRSARSSAKTPSTAIPTTRKSSRRSHTMGQRTSASRATGQQRTKRISHRRTFNTCVP